MPLILPNTIVNDIPADGDKLGQNFATITDWANQEAITRDGSTGMTGPLLLPGAPTQSNQAATKSYVDNFLPLGVMFEYGGVTEPTGWLFCRGQAISRATYAGLYAVIGDRFGPGNGTTTFNLPDMRGRYAVGHNEGGSYFSVGVGEKFGNKDGAVVAHTHAGVDHLHGVNINSGTVSNFHNHNLNHGALMRYAPGAVVDNVNVWAFRVGDGIPIKLEQVNTNATGTGTENQNHYHGVNGSTGAADRSLTTGSTGSSAMNTNLPPSTSFNFIMKVT